MSLVLDNVVKSFGSPPLEILKGISFSIEDGDYLALMGRSGSGKSTLLYVMSTLDNPTAGHIYYSGKSVSSMNVDEIHELRNEKIGFVFQFHYLLSDLNVLENILMPTLKTGAREEKEDYAVSLIEDFGLKHRMDHRPNQLSGGERQRVAIARALIMEPRYLFADEPTGSLDTASGDRVMDILEEINQKKGTTIILVTHDPDYATRARRQIKLRDGRVVDE